MIRLNVSDCRQDQIHVHIVPIMHWIPERSLCLFFFIGREGRAPPAGGPSTGVRAVWSSRVFPILVKASGPTRRLRGGDNCEHSLASMQLNRSSRSCCTSASWSLREFLRLACRTSAISWFIHSTPWLVHHGCVLAAQYWSVSSMYWWYSFTHNKKQNPWPKHAFIHGPLRLLLIGGAPLSLDGETCHHAIPTVATRPRDQPGYANPPPRVHPCSSGGCGFRGSDFAGSGAYPYMTLPHGVSAFFPFGSVCAYLHHERMH